MDSRFWNSCLTNRLPIRFSRRLMKPFNDLSFSGGTGERSWSFRMFFWTFVKVPFSSNSPHKQIIIYIMSLTVRLACMLFAVLILGLLVVDHVSAMHMGQRNNNGVIELLVAGLVAKLLQEHHHHG
ncbi:hypothetical protein TNCT_378681 [Trichonephila clavata]|uniref:Uncharacterized protein n=1 Tax=Trichonephila clavata TaxID=2740835 RepID=A0A8X6HL55_TRICU|nr:hypothetical protein TNCT_378681 [Trichonephila clavata]